MLLHPLLCILGCFEASSLLNFGRKYGRIIKCVKLVLDWILSFNCQIKTDSHRKFLKYRLPMCNQLSWGQLKTSLFFKVLQLSQSIHEQVFQSQTAETKSSNRKPWKISRQNDSIIFFQERKSQGQARVWAWGRISEMLFVPQLLVQIIFFILVNPSSPKRRKSPVT